MNMDEWNALEDAIGQRSWLEAAGKARALLDAWHEAKSAILWFASVEVEEGMKNFEAALSSLVALLGSAPVDVEAVKVAMEQVRAFLPPDEGA